jgi:uncharacterized protein
MTVTDKLVRVFQVDKQLRGLQSRLGGAEKFLKDQTGQLAALATKQTGLEDQLKKLTAKLKDAEGEVARLDARIAQLRAHMESADTHKGHQAFLTEISTQKIEKEKAEAVALEHMTKSDELKKQLEEIATQKVDREKVKAVAADDRTKRQAEIQDRLDELKRERDKLAADVPADAMSTLDRLIHQRGDDAMAAIEVQDARRHEFNCGACMMSLPVDVVFALTTSGRLTKCSSCGCLLFADEETVKAAAPQAAKPPSKAPAKAKKSAKKVEAE